MYSIERQAQILSLLEAHGQVNVAELAVQLGASRETIRRDLAELEKSGVLRRTHGGAVSGNLLASGGEYPLNIRGIRNFREKLDICRKAASLIEDGDLIFVDNSSTCVPLAGFIPEALHVTVLTNSISLIVEAAKSPRENHTYICLGGVFKPSNLSLHGSMALKNARDYFPSKAFMSCTGVNMEQGVFADGSINEVDTKRLMLERSEQGILLADHSKWERNGNVFLARFESVDAIVTDKPEAELRPLASAGIRILYSR